VAFERRAGEVARKREAVLIGKRARQRDLPGHLDFENLDADDGPGFIHVVGDAPSVVQIDRRHRWSRGVVNVCGMGCEIDAYVNWLYHFPILGKDRLEQSQHADCERGRSGFLARSRVKWGLDLGRQTITNPAST
jgi:hypothetical protein